MSEFSKPKVTIDLDEYNELKAYKERFKKLRVSDYHEGLKAVFNCLRTTQIRSIDQLGSYINRELDSKGLVLIIQSDIGQGERFVDIIKDDRKS